MDGIDQELPSETLASAAIDSLIDLLGDDPEGLAQIIDAFLDEAPVRLSEVGAGVRDGNPESAGRAAHTLKANALTFGARGLGEVSREIEALSRAGDLAGTAELIPALEAEWVATRALLVELRDRGPG